MARTVGTAAAMVAEWQRGVKAAGGPQAYLDTFQAADPATSPRSARAQASVAQMDRVLRPSHHELTVRNLRQALTVERQHNSLLKDLLDQKDKQLAEMQRLVEGLEAQVVSLQVGQYLAQKDYELQQTPSR